MKIFDLHNDALTCGKTAESEDIIYAIWTSKLSFKQVAAIVNYNKVKKLAIEDCGVFFNNINQIALHDFMYVGLTWNTYNGIAGGVNCDEHLTSQGKEIIDLLNKHNIPLDTAHLNRVSFYEAADVAKKIICSHTCFNDVNSHPRNLTRNQISVIIKKGGIVGLCFVGEFLGDRSIDAIIRHIDWFLDCFGDKNLSIGTDFYGTVDLPQNLISYENFDKLVLAMIRQGYSDNTIQKILYENAYQYFLYS